MPDDHLGELQDDGGGDPALLPVFVPFEGWILLPDGDPHHPGQSLLCPECSSDKEVIEWMSDGAEAEATIAHVLTTDADDDPTA